MRIVYATYIDNQKEIEYPIVFIKSKITDLIVYCSDEENRQYLESQGIKAKAIGIKIKSPIDISIAQNKCIDDIFLVNVPDFVVWIQADIYINKKGYEIIDDFCIPDNFDKTCALGLMHIKLFHHCGFSYYGVNVIGKNAWERIKYTDDGAYLGSGGADYCAKEDSTIDIGYMTIDQCRRHMKQHKITWNSDDIASSLNDKEFVKTVIKRHNHAGLITEDSPYFELIKEMGLVDEYYKLKSLCEI